MTTGFAQQADNIPLILKDPSAVLDYYEDWQKAGDPWLGASETITGTPAWTLPTGITNSAQTNTATTATIWLAGGTIGTTYLISCKITTNQGRTDTRSFRVRVVAR
jgi:hypothetical protein